MARRKSCIRRGAPARFAVCASLVAGCTITQVNPAPEWPPEPVPDSPSSSSSASSGGFGVRVDAGGDGTTSGATVRDGTYFASCLLELANGQTSKAISFWAPVAVRGGTMTVRLGALELVDGKPPAIAASSDVVGAIQLEGPTLQSFDVTAAELVIPGVADPISGSKIVIALPRLRGRPATGAFCARLSGHVTEPAPAARDLDGEKNVCLFTPTREGQTVPTYTYQDYSVTKCPP